MASIGATTQTGPKRSSLERPTEARDEAPRARAAETTPPPEGSKVSAGFDRVAATDRFERPNVEGTPPSGVTATGEDVTAGATAPTEVRDQLRAGLEAQGAPAAAIRGITEHPVLAEADRALQFQRAYEATELDAAEQDRALRLFASGWDVRYTEDGRIATDAEGRVLADRPPPSEVTLAEGGDAGVRLVAGEGELPHPDDDPRSTGQIMADYARGFNEGLQDLEQRYGRWVGWAVDAASAVIGGPVKFLIGEALGRAVEPLVEEGLEYAADQIQRLDGSLSADDASHLAIAGFTAAGMFLGWRTIKDVVQNLPNHARRLREGLGGFGRPEAGAEWVPRPLSADSPNWPRNFDLPPDLRLQRRGDSYTIHGPNGLLAGPNATQLIIDRGLNIEGVRTPAELMPRIASQLTEPLQITPGLIDGQGRVLGRHNAGLNAPRFDTWLQTPGNRIDLLPNGDVRYSGNIPGMGPVHVNYRGGAPDFTPFMTHPSGVQAVRIDLTPGNRPADNRAAGQAAIAQYGDTMSDADRAIFARGETPQGWTWHHHEDGRTMMLIPFEINDVFTHIGGASPQN